MLSSTPCYLSLNLILVKYFHSRGHRLMEKQTRQVDRVISEGRGIEGSKILQYRRYRNMHMCSSKMAHLSLLPPVTLTALHHYWETRTDNEYNNMDPTPSLPITIALHVGAQIHPLNVILYTEPISEGLVRLLRRYNIPGVGWEVPSSAF